MPKVKESGQKMHVLFDISQVATRSNAPWLRFNINTGKNEILEWSFFFLLSFWAFYTKEVSNKPDTHTFFSKKYINLSDVSFSQSFTKKFYSLLK